MRLRKKLICLFVVAMMLVSSFSSAFAANEYAYSSAFSYTSLGNGATVAKGSYKYGFLNANTGKWQIKKVGLYSGYVSNYRDKSGSAIWFANQGQTISVTETITASRTVSQTAQETGSFSVSGSVALSKVLNMGLNIGKSYTNSYTNSYTTTYSKSTCSSYNLSNFKHKSYSFASWGIICKNLVQKFDKKGKQVYSKNMYTFYKAYGQEMRLVYR